MNPPRLDEEELRGRALIEARERGHRSASPRAGKAGSSLYERIGFRDPGLVEMWESRR